MGFLFYKRDSRFAIYPGKYCLPIVFTKYQVELTLYQDLLDFLWSFVYNIFINIKNIRGDFRW